MAYDRPEAIDLFADAAMNHHGSVLAKTGLIKSLWIGSCPRKPDPCIDPLFCGRKIVSVQNVSFEINYGIEDFRFGVPVKVNSEVSLQATIRSVYDLRGMI